METYKIWFGHNRPYTMKTSAITIGPFTVFPLKEVDQQSLPTGKHGMEEVPKGNRTVSHKHHFLSLYLVTGLTLFDGIQTHQLPEHALVIVPPGQEHSWICDETAACGSVGSIDNRHDAQELMAVT